MIKTNSNTIEKSANSFVCIEEPIGKERILKRQNHLDSLDLPDSEDSSRIFLKVPTLTVGEWNSETICITDPISQKSDETNLNRQKSLILNSNSTSLKRNRTISGIHCPKKLKKPKIATSDLNQSFNLLNVKQFDSTFHIFNPLDTFKTNKGSKENDDGTQSEQSLSEYIGGGAPGYRHPRLSASMYLKEQICSLFQPGDNKLAMKLFGTQSALLKEKSRQKKHGHWIIHPCSSFRFYWDLLMLMVLVANLIVLPVAISFFNDDLSKRWIIFNGISDTIFLIDIGVNFRTGIILNDFADEIVLIPKEIAKHYIKSWFIIDFLSSIPVDYIFLILNSTNHFSQFMHAGRALRILRLAKLLSLLRLLRLSRLVRYISQWEEFFNTASKFIGIFNLVLMMLLLGHWNACLQFLIPMMREFPNDCWIIKCNLKDASWFDQYTWSLFKAMSHMLSIGYGRFPPTSTSEAWVTIISMMTGATCYALFVGHAAALIQSYDTSKRLYREKYKQVEEYMGYRKLPRLLRQKITDYYEHRYQGNMFNETEILQEFSECLREQIINYNCRGLVAAVPFFKNADDSFVSEVVVKLRYEVFQPGDFIIKEGTVGTRMYFIQEGIVDIITKEGEVATSLSDGSYFGEICLLADTRRVASVHAVTYCNVYSLDRESFLSVLEHYPIMRRTMESVAAERLNKIGQNPHIVSDRSDLKEDLRIVNEFVNEAASTHSSDDNKSVTSKASSKKPFKIQKIWNLRKTTLEAGLLWKSKVQKPDQNSQNVE